MITSPLYTNINHEEVHRLVIKKLEDKNSCLWTYILDQTTRMIPNYANLFMNYFLRFDLLRNFLLDYFYTTGLSLLLCFRYIYNPPFIWTVIKNCWIISLLSRKITLNPRTWNLKSYSKFVSQLTNFTLSWRNRFF